MTLAPIAEALVETLLDMHHRLPLAEIEDLIKDMPDGDARRALIKTSICKAPNAQEIAAFAAKEAHGPWRLDALRDMAWRWSLENADAAATWAASLPDPAERDEVLARIVIDLSSQDPQKAANWASHIRNKTLREDSVQGFRRE